MTKRFGTVILGVAIAALPVFSQVETRRATMNGRGGDRGKCTIEVEVDGAADVELFADSGRVRTLSGSPAIWRRFECNSPIPRNPSEFRFTGVDGRGRQSLVAEPGGNRGTAVIRIEDSKSGREGYTFDVEWRGGDNSGRGGYDRPNGYEGQYRGDYASVCEDAVRERAQRDLGSRELRFSAADQPGDQRADSLSGVFEVRRGNRAEQFQYTCSIGPAGRVRNVDIRAMNERGYRDDPARRCENAVAARLDRDGFTDPRFQSRGNANRDARNQGETGLSGFVTAHRGAVDRDMVFTCRVDNNGNVKSIDLRRR
jgi:hypothetical protein